jgi:branched-subunit amino acid transport protein AzlD
MVCLLILIPIKKIITTHHNIIIFDKRKFTRPNINVLIEKWMPFDLMWVLKCLNFKYVLRLKGNEKYCYEEIMLEEFWLELLISDPHEKKLS